MTSNQEAIRRMFGVSVGNTGNLPPQPGVYPDYFAPIVRNSVDGRELVVARWGMPAPRKVREGETTNDLYAFLTINPNAEVSAIHPKAMPVILRTLEEMDIWMTAPAADALKLQRPLPDGTLRVVATGAKIDEPLVAATSP